MHFIFLSLHQHLHRHCRSPWTHLPPPMPPSSLTGPQVRHSNTAASIVIPESSDASSLLLAPTTPPLLLSSPWTHLPLLTHPLSYPIPRESQSNTANSVLGAAPLGSSSLNYFPSNHPSSLPITWDRIPPPTPTLLTSIPQDCCYSVAASKAKAIPLGGSYLPLTPPTPLLLASIMRTHIHPPIHFSSSLTH